MAQMPTVYVTIANGQAISALAEAYRLIYEASQDAPWSEDLKDALECLRTASRGLELKPQGRNT